MSKKKEEQLAQAQKTAEAARQAAAPQSGYSTADLNSRSDVQNALAGAEYRPSQNVTDAANDLKQWQQNRPGQYQSCLLYTSPSPRDRTRSRMPSSA